MASPELEEKYHVARMAFSSPWPLDVLRAELSSDVKVTALAVKPTLSYVPKVAVEAVHAALREGYTSAAIFLCGEGDGGGAPAEMYTPKSSSYPGGDRVPVHANTLLKTATKLKTSTEVGAAGYVPFQAVRVQPMDPVPDLAQAAVYRINNISQVTTSGASDASRKRCQPKIRLHALRQQGEAPSTSCSLITLRARGDAAGAFSHFLGRPAKLEKREPRIEKEGAPVWLVLRDPPRQEGEASSWLNPQGQGNDLLPELNAALSRGEAALYAREEVKLNPNKAIIFCSASSRARAAVQQANIPLGNHFVGQGSLGSAGLGGGFPPAVSLEALGEPPFPRGPSLGELEEYLGWVAEPAGAQ